MKQKKLMLLGGIRYLTPVIEAAHKQGYYVITADYLPNNIAHKYSDEYVNVSIIDKEAVLQVAIEKDIDGIMSFGVDPGVISASYVQNKLGLPSFGPFESVEILQNKDKFRNFLETNGFNVPWSFAYSSTQEAYADRERFTYPLIVKPTDSAGSKGVTCVKDGNQLLQAIEYAMKFSIGKHIIIEEFIDKRGCSSDSDCYVKDGKFEFVSYSAQRFDQTALNPFTPAAYSWPSTFTVNESCYLNSELQRLITLLGIKTAVFNIETRVGVNGKPYIMECTPRGGGNRLSEMLRYATGVDMITAITRYIVGDTPTDISQREYRGHWAEVILHSDLPGQFKCVEISSSIRPFIVEEDLWVQPGDTINGFEGANDAIGTLVLNFDSSEHMEQALCDLSWMKVVVE